MLKFLFFCFIFLALSLSKCLFLPLCLNAQTWHSVGFNFGNNTAGLDVLKVIDNELYAGGAFLEITGAQLGNGLIKFNGSNWFALGNGLSSNPVSIVKYNSFIYSVGTFLSANGVPNTKHIARWNGMQWSALPNTTASQNAQLLSCLAFNNSLYVGGRLFNINGDLYDCLARWNGSLWQQPFNFTGFTTSISSMVIYNGNLVIGGIFSTVAGVAANDIAMFDGVQWHPLGNGISNPVGEMVVDTVANVLYCTGETLNIDGKSVLSVGRWDGANWTFIPVYTNGISALGMFNNDLYVSGSPSPDTLITDTVLVRWDGSQLHHVIGPNQEVSCMAVYQGNLYVGGVFNYVDTIYSPWLACYGNNCPIVNSVAPIKKKETDSFLSIYPNPAKSSITIEVTSGLTPSGVRGNAGSNSSELRITDQHGKLIKSYQITESDSKTEINTKGWAKGTYLCSLMIGKKTVKTEKLVIE